MYLFFSNWSNRTDLIERLRDAGLVHTNSLYKVHASSIDPREEIAEKPNLQTLEISGEPFKPSDQFPFEGRRGYTGGELEEALLRRDLHGEAAKITRALLRFSYSEEMTIAQFAMSIPRGHEGWAYNHPLEILHGLRRASQIRQRASAIHLDIFTGRSVENLRQVIDLDKPELMLSHREATKFISGLRSSEGVLVGKER